MTAYDQKDINNASAAESIPRNKLCIEHEMKKMFDAKKGGDASEYYLGRSKKAGGNFTHPDLQKYVADKAAGDSAIRKEQRESSEERALLRKDKKDKG